MLSAVVSGGNEVYYPLSRLKTMPEMLEEALKNHKSLRKSAEFKGRLELIQGMHFSTGSQMVKVSRDGQYIGVCGMYPPDFKVFDAEELSQKFVRRTVSEIVDFEFLTEDFRKVALLETDRSLEFHNAGGLQHKLRIPTCGRSISYNWKKAEMAIGADGGVTYMMDLQAGRFSAKLSSDLVRDVRKVVYCHENPSLLFTCGESECVEMWDTRRSKVCGSFKTSAVRAVTAMAQHPIHSYEVAIGSDEGLCQLFDVRSAQDKDGPNSVIEKDHQIDEPIVDLTFASVAGLDPSATAVVSADRKFIRVWEAKKAKTLLTVESETRINSICVYPQSGLILAAEDHPKVGIYFAPGLGLAPKWAPFLDSVIEDLNLTPTNAFYTHFEFITGADIAALGNTEEVKEAIKPHMHGFLINRKVYRKLREAAGLEASEKAIFDEKVKEKVAGVERGDPMRIRVPVSSSVPKERVVNRSLADSLMAQATHGRKAVKRKAAELVLGDSRFDAFFKDSRFAVERV